MSWLAKSATTVQPMRTMHGRLVAVLMAAASLAACATRSAPATSVSAPERPPAEPPPPYRPLHKGGVDLSSGLYIREDDDLFVNTAMPLVLRRTYLSGDRVTRRFGIGATHPGEWWLYGDGNPRIPWADLNLANGERIHFTRISAGNTQENAVLRHDSTATPFNGALLRWTGSRWEMRMRDGSLALFLDCQDAHSNCLLVERRDAQGHRIEYVRDAAQRLLSMESDGQRIAFDYDDRKRIVRASDTSGRAVTYTYDDRGRLVRAAATDGVTRTYAYDDRDNLTAVHEPGRIVENWYDGSGRFSRQEVRSAENDDDPYIATARYVIEGDTIVEADFDEGDGLRRYRYNRHHYAVSETWNADSPAPAAFIYDRDATTNEVNGVVLSCRSETGAVVRPIPPASVRDDDDKWMAIRTNCGPR